MQNVKRSLTIIENGGAISQQNVDNLKPRGAKRSISSRRDCDNISITDGVLVMKHDQKYRRKASHMRTNTTRVGAAGGFNNTERFATLANDNSKFNTAVILKGIES